MKTETQPPKIFFLYKITNLINNKIYIGKTAEVNPEQRFKNHKYFAFCKSTKNDCPKLYRSMRKHGTENFSFEVISELDNEILAYELEIIYIKEYQSIKYGMNIAPGGKGALSGKLNPMYGKGYLIAGDKNGMYGMTGDLNPFYGKTHPAKFIEEIKKQNRVLSNDMIISIKNMLLNKTSYKIIKEIFNVSSVTLNRIKGGRRYADIALDINLKENLHISEQDVNDILTLWFQNPKIENERLQYKIFYEEKVKGNFTISYKKLGNILRGNTWKHIYDKLRPSTM